LFADNLPAPASEPISSDVRADPDAIPVRARMSTIAAWPWQAWAFAGWLAGSIGFMAIVASRVLRFQRLLKHAAPASPSLLAIATEAAHELDVRRAPRLLVISARVPPLLWPVGRRPTIVMPGDVIDKLSETQLRHVLAHEMAHVARRDHWVRWFVAAVATLYWWHPVFWLAGRRLRTAEEACCDALVVGRCRAATARQYAGTLLEIVDFVAATTAPPPALGSGMGGRTQLKRRIEMLLENRVPARLSTLAKLCLIVTAIAVLPLSAVAWQAEQPTDQNSPPSEEQEAKAVEKMSAHGMRVVIELPDAPYRIAPGDLLQIEAPAESLFPDAPIKGTYLVEPGGNVQLGPQYGRVFLKGSTLAEAEEKIEKYLAKLVRSPQIAVTIGGWRNPEKQRLAPIPGFPYRIAAGDLLEINSPKQSTLPDAPIEGLYLVEPGGTVQLGPAYGRVAVDDLSLEEAEAAIRTQLSQSIREPLVAVTLGGWKLALEQGGEAVAAKTGGLDEELVAALREYVSFLEMSYQTAEARYKTGASPQTDVLIAGYELSAARAELAQAEGSLEEALNHRQQAREAAEASVKFLETMRASAQVTDDQLVTKAAHNLLQAKIQLIAAKRALTLADGGSQEPRP
jgi:beta-lactamase regulating signal transducer with metallopeptidase domain/protein involved in polysaccharide export with SLBB domain